MTSFRKELGIKYRLTCNRRISGADRGAKMQQIEPPIYVAEIQSFSRFLKFKVYFDIWPKFDI